MERSPTTPTDAGTLERFLAARDVPCTGCGYNLRGVSTVFCPECGAVIPFPTESEVDELNGRLRRLAWCARCRYPLENSRADHCPECGASAYVTPPAAVQWQRFSRSVPITMIVAAGLAR
jgi:predicted RNA-binding Zn-ribbon protein involved in translation (DUF1610 family)